MVLPLWHVATTVVALNVASSIAAPLPPPSDSGSSFGRSDRHTFSQGSSSSPPEVQGDSRIQGKQNGPQPDISNSHHTPNLPLSPSWRTLSSNGHRPGPSETHEESPGNKVVPEPYSNHAVSQPPENHPIATGKTQENHAASKPPAATAPAKKPSFLEKLRKGAGHDIMNNPVSIGVSLLGASVAIASVIHTYKTRRDVGELEDSLYGREPVLDKLD